MLLVEPLLAVLSRPATDRPAAPRAKGGVISFGRKIPSDRPMVEVLRLAMEICVGERVEWLRIWRASPGGAPAGPLGGTPGGVRADYPTGQIDRSQDYLVGRQVGYRLLRLQLRMPCSSVCGVEC